MCVRARLRHLSSAAASIFNCGNCHPILVLGNGDRPGAGETYENVKAATSYSVVTNRHSDLARADCGSVGLVLNPWNCNANVTNARHAASA